MNREAALLAASFIGAGPVCRPTSLSETVSTSNLPDPDPARALALRTSRRIDPAARLRRLFDRCKTGAPAGPALALDPAPFGSFHFRPRKPVRSIRPHPGSHPLMDQQSVRAKRAVIPVYSRSRPGRFCCPFFAEQSNPNGAGSAELEPQAKRPSQTQTAAASLSAPARALVHVPAVNGGFSSQQAAPDTGLNLFHRCRD